MFFYWRRGHWTIVALTVLTLQTLGIGTRHRSRNADENGAVFEGVNLVKNMGGQGNQVMRAEFEPLSLGAEGDASIKHQHCDGARGLMFGKT